MIKNVSGDLFEADVDALVNAVNTEGVMNRGIALQFKKRYPSMFRDYARRCKLGDLYIGTVHFFEIDTENKPFFIINFPTKELWINPSEISYIRTGLSALRAKISSHGIKSIAIPALGCGLGQLKWEEVKPIISEYCNTFMPDIEVLLYEPC